MSTPDAPRPDPSNLGSSNPSGSDAGHGANRNESIGYPLDPPLSASDAPGGTSSYGTPAYGAPTPAAGVPAASVPPARSGGGLSKGQILAITPIVATILFFLCGFLFGGWVWSWLFFLAVPIVGIVVNGDKGKDERSRR